MKTIDLYRIKADCCGCELCCNLCPNSIIQMKPDEEGFLYPQISSEKRCINCQLCVKSCPQKSPGRLSNKIISAWGGYVKREEEIRKSASGGFATSISSEFIKNGGVVYGVAYAKDFNIAKYFRADSLKKIEDFRTSKYVQAYKGRIYDNIINDLHNGKKVLFIGLPCEVSAVYHKVKGKDENLFTISLICHGPTSPKIHEQYICCVKEKFKSSIDRFSVRHKLKGWKPYYIHAEFSSGAVYNEKFEISDYGIAFQYLKRPSCSSCKYKYSEKHFGIVSDLTLGDFHAVSSNMPHYNLMGVSEALVHTSKGNELVSIIKNNCFIESIPISSVLTGNRALYQSILEKAQRQKFVEIFMSKGLASACKLRIVRYPIYKSFLHKKGREVLKKIMRVFYVRK